MNLHEVLAKVPEPRRIEFLKFIETGEASDEFFTYLNGDREALEAVDAIFERQAQVLEDLASSLRTHDPVQVARDALATPASARTVTAVANDLTRALTHAVVMPEADRRAVVERTVAAIEEAAPEGTEVELRKTVAEIAEAVG